MNFFKKWARKKATAIKAGRPRDVLALGTDAEEGQASDQSQPEGTQAGLERAAKVRTDLSEIIFMQTGITATQFSKTIAPSIYFNRRCSLCLNR